MVYQGVYEWVKNFLQGRRQRVVESPIAWFADDTKVYRVEKNEQDCHMLQKDINQLDKWARKWQLPFNESKCKVMHFGRGNPGYDYWIGNGKITEHNYNSVLPCVSANVVDETSVVWTSGVESAGGEVQENSYFITPQHGSEWQ
ncbi:hypothetical protein Pcinc_002749 [Petrolisthes cinctipes]|uniref:Reverse transcriptase domain-containing protein n=1 Tax=Petrolisthes cinctipes TaxID=88211 RepID=A0AAE1L574_PETCI|nr:hypothetical protein Pcinc_002749 [Petrolisthes cinctipes]